MDRTVSLLILFLDFGVLVETSTCSGPVFGILCPLINRVPSFATLRVMVTLVDVIFISFLVKMSILYHMFI